MSGRASGSSRRAKAQVWRFIRPARDLLVLQPTSLSEGEASADRAISRRFARAESFVGSGDSRFTRDLGLALRDA